MILPLARIGGIAKVTGVPDSPYSVIEANQNAPIVVVFMGVLCLRHSVTMLTRIACRD